MRRDKIEGIIFGVRGAKMSSHQIKVGLKLAYHDSAAETAGFSHIIIIE